MKKIITSAFILLFGAVSLFAVSEAGAKKFEFKKNFNIKLVDMNIVNLQEFKKCLETTAMHKDIKACRKASSDRKKATKEQRKKYQNELKSMKKEKK